MPFHRKPGPKSRSIYFLLSDALLFVLYGSVLLVLVVPFSWELAALAAASYVLRMGGVTLGYHRYFSHRTYKTSRAVQLALALLGATAMQNGPIWWASVHRAHHRHADTDLDWHSPVHFGFWQAHMGWTFDHSREHADYSNVRDLMRFPELRFVDRHFWLPLAAWGLLTFAIAGVPGFIWGFVVSTVAVQQATMCINSVAHRWGKRRYPTKDNSRNNALLAIITLGEGWHNNHHHYMSSARQGFLWWELDLSYYALRAFSRVGLVWDVREPPRSLLSR